MEAVKWPTPATLLAIGEQSHKVSEFIRDALPTTGVSLRFSAQRTGPVITELERLAYLFYGRSLEDYDSDQEQTARQGWSVSLAGWIMATPGPREHPAVESFLRDEPNIATHARFQGWGNRVGLHVDAIFFGLATLRVYFGQVVFQRNEWIAAGEWLRHEVSSRALGTTRRPDAEIGHWFNGPLCRSPMYNLRRPPPFCAPDHVQRPAPVPSEIDRCGTFNDSKTDGIPTEWLDELSNHAAKLLAELIPSRKGQVPNSDIQPSYLVSDLTRELDISSKTLNKYAKAAGVKTPGRGQRNYRYSAQDRSRIIAEIINHSPDSAMVERARQLSAMRSRAETER